VITQSLTFERGKVVLEELCIPALIAVAEVMKVGPAGLATAATAQPTAAKWRD
jgi:hypothetical protein